MYKDDKAPVGLKIESGPEPIRLAIIGCGPKGLYALESLCTLAAQETPPPHFDITIYEETCHPGAGAIYDPSQPDFLLMNFASSFIDAWGREAGDRTISPPSARRPSLVDWLKDQAPEHADPGGFVSRATVGRYLGACLTEVLAERPESIRGVSASSASWRSTERTIAGGYARQAMSTTLTKS